MILAKQHNSGLLAVTDHAGTLLGLDDDRPIINRVLKRRITIWEEYVCKQISHAKTSQQNVRRHKWSYMHTGMLEQSNKALKPDDSGPQ